MERRLLKEEKLTRHDLGRDEFLFCQKLFQAKTVQTVDGRNPVRNPVQNSVNNGISYLSTGAEFVPSTACVFFFWKINGSDVG